MMWKIQDRTIAFGRRGAIMGIVNATPDSFSDGGQFLDPDAAVEHALNLVAEGAEFIDVGGESTRPRATPVDADEEKRRVLPVIAGLRKKSDVLISVDTYKPEVAEAAIRAGANIINNIAGFGGHDEMLDVVNKTGAGIVCMHMQGNPGNMQQSPRYDDVVRDVKTFFDAKLTSAIVAGIDPERVVFDPGIGFGKTLEHNLTLLRHLPSLRVADRPILVGVSRKSFIGKVLGSEKMEDRFWPTVAMTAFCAQNGADILRVHDVRANYYALRMMEAIRG
ncbi:MAG TPA: dihydropteroate synthase [Chthoniobacterales bacterium]